MPTPHPPTTRSTHRISGPAELLQAIPYLLGFHPQHSLVLVGLHAGQLVVTARLDLPDAEHAATLAHTVDLQVRGGASEVVAIAYADRVRGDAGLVALCDRLAAVTAERGGRLLDVLLVAYQRWWSVTCRDPACCRPDGEPLLAAPSPFTAAATVDGVVALPDRAALAAQLDPLPDDRRLALDPLVAAAEHDVVRAATDDRLSGHRRRATRELLRLARHCDQPGWRPPDDPRVARLGVALSALAVRDPVWLAVDGRRVDGRALWRELARRLPSPYDAAPLFLFGWAAWRAGSGAQARIAAERAVDSDPDYTAADLLLAALANGVDPRKLPRLRQPRSA